MFIGDVATKGKYWDVGLYIFYIDCLQQLLLVIRLVSLAYLWVGNKLREAVIMDGPRGVWRQTVQRHHHLDTEQRYQHKCRL